MTKNSSFFKVQNIFM